MSDVLKTGLDWLADQMVTFCAQSVLYARGANNVTLNAVIESRRKLGDDEYADFCIRATDLVISAAQTLPAAGDTISLGGNVWQVFDPGDGIPDESIYHWTDPNQKAFRVHTIKQ